MSSLGGIKKGISKNQNGLTNAAERLSALQRLDALEESFSKLIQVLSKDQTTVAQKLENIERGLNAVAELVGRKSVEEKASEMHVVELEAKVANVDEAIKASLTAGAIVPTDTVAGEHIFVVTQQKNEKGEVLHPSKIQLELEGYTPEVRALLVDKKVGETIVLPTGGSLTVLEVYLSTGKKEADTANENNLANSALEEPALQEDN
jgi:hypothetical protein